MNRRFLPLLMLCSVPLLLASCLVGNDDEQMSYDDAAIIGFSVKNVKRLVHTKSSKGTDSTYTTTFAASDHLFYIDQLNRVIYNPDSLPVGVDASKVVATISAKNAGVIGIRNADNDAVKYFNSADSLDFTKPRKVVVFNNAGTGMNTYTVHVNVHRQDGDAFNWSSQTKNEPKLGELAAMRLLANGEDLYVFGNKGSEAKIYTAARKVADKWREITPNIRLTSDFYRQVVLQGKTFYGYHDGQVVKSADAKNWSVVSTVALKQLVGASNAKLYALTENHEMVVSADGGATWQAETLSPSNALLPEADLNFAVQPSKTNAGANQLFMAGTTDQRVAQWGKIEENDEKAENQPWTSYTPSAGNRFALPNLTNLQVVKYGDALVAMGGAGKGESNGVKAFSEIYGSVDGGLTWKKHATLVFPEGFHSSETSFAMTTDVDHYLWIVCAKTGQVWRGRLNKLGWPVVKRVITE